MPPTHNLAGRIGTALANSPESVAIERTGRPPLTRAALAGEIARHAGVLHAAGVGRGDRVTVQVDKSVENAILYLATLQIGAVFNPLNPAYTVAELDYFIGNALPRLVVASAGRLAELAPIIDRHGVVATLSLEADGTGSLGERAATATPITATAEVAADDLAALIYTSGTTGRSKGAMITHGNLVSNAEALIDAWRISGSDVLIHALPIFHVHGLFVALHTTLLTGARLLWLDRFDAADILRLLPRATLLMGVPTFYTRLLAEPALTADACRDIRLFVSGSAPLLAETHREFSARTGHAILERYGMTETGMITSNPYDGERIAGTVGFVLPGIAIRLADAEGRPVAPGEPGVVEVKGPNVFRGYWRMPEKTAEDFRADGAFVTGDVGTLAPDGRLTLIGRAKDVVISGGLNVYPAEVEELINALPGVEESAVIGVPHADFGEAVVAVLTPRRGSAAPDESAVIAALAGRLARFKLPKRVLVVDALPRNAMGKVQKAELRRMHAGMFAE